MISALAMVLIGLACLAAALVLTAFRGFITFIDRNPEG